MLMILMTLGEEKAVGKIKYCECSALARILGHLLGSSLVSRAVWLLVIMSGMWAMTKPSLKSSWSSSWREARSVMGVSVPSLTSC